MIQLQNVTIDLEGKLLLRKVNFSVQSAQIVRLIGANGCGKTTLLNAILGLRAIKEGVIERQFQGSDYGYLPQVAHQHPKIYVQLRDLCRQPFSFYPETLLSKDWHTASGGERKRALIARAISQAIPAHSTTPPPSSPPLRSLLVLDEPFSHLDQDSLEKVGSTLHALNQQGLTILYTGHDFSLPGSLDIEVSQWKC